MRCGQHAHELTWIHTEPFGDLDDVVQRDVALAALDLADVRPMQVAPLCQTFLAETLLSPEGAHTGAELGSGRGQRSLPLDAWHVPSPSVS